MDGKKLVFQATQPMLVKIFLNLGKRVGENHGVLNQPISAVARYCYEHLLTGRELIMHLKENTLINAADFEEEPQGIDWWIDLSLEADMLESHGCIPTFAEDGKSAK